MNGTNGNSNGVVPVVANVGAMRLADVEVAMRGEISPNTLLTLKIPGEWRSVIDGIATRTHTSVSQVCRKMLEVYFRE